MVTSDGDELALDPVALAVQERFLREWRAGKRPRLSAYTRRYPQQAAALADLVASLPYHALADPAHDTAETAPESFPAPLWSGQGAQRALSAIFSVSADTRHDDQLPRVAEERAVYNAEPARDPSANDADDAD